jgi:hypothetical protein
MYKCNTVRDIKLGVHLNVSNFSFSSLDSEENVWKLCCDVNTRHQSELQHCQIIFVSNDCQTVPLWRQKAGKDEEKLVIWVRNIIKFLF